FRLRCVQVLHAAGPPPATAARRGAGAGRAPAGPVPRPGHAVGPADRRCGGGFPRPREDGGGRYRAGAGADPAGAVRRHRPVRLPAVPAGRRGGAGLLEAHPSVVAVTANLHPDHTTAVEGAREIHLAGASSIAIRTGDVTLFSRPQSFLQTNTEVAGQLYRQAAAWTAEIAEQLGGSP